jgi:lycopene cyclase domain-containing protein
MKWYLSSFVIGSLIVQLIIMRFVGKYIRWFSLIICVCVTFLMLLPIEIWATNKGIWSWGDHITICKLGNIPFEEMLLYCTSAMTTVVLFELVLSIVKRIGTKSNVGL